MFFGIGGAERVHGRLMNPERIKSNRGELKTRQDQRLFEVPKINLNTSHVNRKKN
jgi:hypothetical protein